MPLLTRLSDSFWSLVSPVKTDTDQIESSPQTVPKIKTTAVSIRRGSPVALQHGASSLSTEGRANTWRMTERSSSGRAQDLKRRAHELVDIDAERRGKMRKSYAYDTTYAPAESSDEDVDAGFDDEHIIHEAARRKRGLDAFSRGRTSNVAKIVRSSSPSSHQDWTNFDTDMIDETTVIIEDEGVMDPDSPSHAPPSLPSPTTALKSRGLTTADLQAQGWDADHITLVQKIALRGYEPLLPETWKLDFRFLPDALFTPDPPNPSLHTEFDPISTIHSIRDQPFRGSRALERLLELGGRVRDRILLAEVTGGTITPEQQVRRSLVAYMKWAHDDSAILSPRSTIPLLVIETQPVHIAPATLQANARRKLARLASQWRAALGDAVQRSIESSPKPEPLPTLYAIIASHTIMALVAYRPDDEEDEIRNVALFDWKDRDYDVWNSLALAILVCLLRKVQVRMARETGVGLMVEGEGEEEEGEDPDA